MTIQAKILGAIAMSGLAAFAMTSQAQCSDRAGMQRQIPGCQNRRHARRPEVERLPESPVRRRRYAAPPPPLRRLHPLRLRLPRPRKPPRKNPRRKAKEAAAPAAPSGPAVYPNAVDPKYSKETAGKARMHTCVDQYNANKATNGNGGLKWIQKGGGYYSECSKKLKGAA